MWPSWLEILKNWNRSPSKIKWLISYHPGFYSSLSNKNQRSQKFVKKIFIANKKSKSISNHTPISGNSLNVQNVNFLWKQIDYGNSLHDKKMVCGFCGFIGNSEENLEMHISHLWNLYLWYMWQTWYMRKMVKNFSEIKMH